MEKLLEQAFLYYDVDGVGALSIDDVVVVLRSANVAVDKEDVQYFVQAEYGNEGQNLTSVTFPVCLRMAQLYSQRKVGLVKVASALKTFETGTTKCLNVQELRHCLRALTPPSLYVTGSDVADLALKNVVPDSQGYTTQEAVLRNFE